MQYTVTGTSFPELKAGTAVALYIEDATKTPSTSSGDQIDLFGQTLSPTGASSCANNEGQVAVNANGGFQAVFLLPEAGLPCGYVHDLPWLSGGYNVFASYTPSSTGVPTLTSTVHFTITPYVQVYLATDQADARYLPATSSGHWGQWVQIEVFGFASADSVTLVGLPTATGVVPTLTTDNYGASDTISSNNEYVHLMGDTVGGAKSVVAFGTSGASASTTFTIIPSIVVYPTVTSSSTLLSVPSTAPASLYLALHGFADEETISAVTVNGQATSVAAITTTANGAYGYAPNHLSALYTSSLSYGMATVTVTGSTTGTVTFDYANANIVNPFGVWSGTNVNQWTGASALSAFNLNKVPIIASESTTTTGSTAIQVLSETTGKFGDSVKAFYTGLTAGDTLSSSSSAVTLTSYSIVNSTSITAAGAADANGVAVGSFKVPDLPRGPATMTTAGTFAKATVAATTFNMIPSLTFYDYGPGIQAPCPYTYTGCASSAVSNDYGGGLSEFTNSPSDNQPGMFAVIGHGFGGTNGLQEGLTLTIGPDLVSSSLTQPTLGTTGCVTANVATCSDGVVDFQVISNSGAGFPDLAAGSYPVVAAGGTAGDNATGWDEYFYFTYGTYVTAVTVVPSLQLTNDINNGNIAPGSSETAGTTIVLTTSNTAGIHGLAASTMYSVNLDSPTGPVLTTFTSTASGQVPAGAQFPLPSATAGYHFFDINTAGASVVFGNDFSALDEDADAGQTTTCSLAYDCASAYASLYIDIAGSITVTPSAGNVGATVTVTGAGLAPSTDYAVQLGGITYTSFTSGATGGIPSGVSFTFPATATTTESGTAESVNMYNTATDVVDATGSFLLQSAMDLNATSVAPGGDITATATGLVASQSYDIIWNPGYTANGLTTGTVVGAFTANGFGSGGATFTVPASAAAGAYPVQLYRTSDSLGSTTAFRLVSPPTLTVTAAPTTGVSTSTLSPVGSASESVVNGQATVTQGFTNTHSTSLSVYMWVSVMNSAGQTVGVFLGSATIASGATTSIGAALFNLPAGTYTATVFCTTTSGIVISTTSTTSSFSV